MEQELHVIHQCIFHRAWGMKDPQQTFMESVNSTVPAFKRFLPIFTWLTPLCLSGLNSDIASFRKLFLISRMELIPHLCVPITPWTSLLLSFSLKREKQVNKCFQDFYQPLSNRRDRDSKTIVGLMDWFKNSGELISYTLQVFHNSHWFSFYFYRFSRASLTSLAKFKWAEKPLNQPRGRRICFFSCC